MDGHPTRFTLLGRRQIEVNTDPQRRCYNGCHFSSEMVWTDWQHLTHPANKEEGEETMEVFQRTNPKHEYRLLPPTGVS